jgi:hypothetical protein
MWQVSFSKFKSFKYKKRLFRKMWQNVNVYLLHSKRDNETIQFYDREYTK